MPSRSNAPTAIRHFSRGVHRQRPTLQLVLRFAPSFTQVVTGLCSAVFGMMLAFPATAHAAVGNAPQTRAWQANGRVSAIAVVGTTAYLGGSFTRMISPNGSRYVARAHLAAINIVTGAPLSWHPGTNRPVLAVSASGGRLLVGGAFTRAGGKSRNHIASISRSTGRLTAGWTASANASVQAIAVNHGRVFLAGAFTSVNHRPRGHLAAVSGQSGTIVAGWRPSVNSAVHALAVDPAVGVIYAGGDFTTANGQAAGYLQPFSVSTGRRRAWRSHPDARVWSVAIGGGRVFAATGGTGGHLEAFNQAGTALWQRWADGDFQAIAYSRGVVFAGGHFANACQTSAGGGTPWVCAQPIPRARLMSVSASTGALGPWNPTADSKWGVYAVRVTRTRLLAGGDFKHVHGIHRWRYAQFTR